VRGGRGVPMSKTRSSGLYERRRKFYRHIISTLLLLRRRNSPRFWHELTIFPPLGIPLVCLWSRGERLWLNNVTSRITSKNSNWGKYTPWGSLIAHPPSVTDFKLMFTLGTKTANPFCDARVRVQSAKQTKPRNPNNLIYFGKWTVCDGHVMEHDWRA
jgi:hypothetical protein